MSFSERQHSRLSRSEAILLVTALLVLLGVAGAGAYNALGTIGRACSEVFFTPHGVFSAVLRAKQQILGGLTFPDPLQSIDNTPILEQPFPRSLTIAAVIQKIYEGKHGDEPVLSKFKFAKAGEVFLELRLRSASEVGFFFCCYTLVGLFALWSGVLVLLLAGQHSGGRMYAAWSVSAYLLLVTFYDYHTTTRLMPWFFAAGTGFELCFLWLAYTFPEPPTRLRRPLLAALWTVTAVALGLGLWMVLSPQSAAPAILAHSFGVPASMLVFFVSLVLRLRWTTGPARVKLRSTLWGLATAPALLGLGLLFALTDGWGSIHWFLPLLVLLIPLSVGVSLVRHNLLRTNAILTSWLLTIPTVLAVMGVTLLGWLALQRFELGQMAMLLVLLVGLPLLLGFAALFHRLTQRVFFPAASQFRPTLEQLSDQLASLQEAADIRRAVEEVVARWLPASDAIRVIDARELSTLPNLPQDGASRLQAGEHVWTQESPWQRSLIMPMRSLGKLRALLVLPPKKWAALYTSEDLVLLASIANLGAVALHHAETLRELEELRRQQVEATRDEKRFALGLLSAELVHETAIPLGFFRLLLTRGAGGKPLTPRDIEIGTEEVTRLERLLASLQKLQFPRPQIAPLPLLDRVERAMELIRELLEQKHISTQVDVPSLLVIRADPDMLRQILLNLLRNAAQAAPVEGRIQVVATQDGAAVTLEVRDNGPGVPDEFKELIWQPFVTTRQGGAGIGLAVTQRLARAMGWEVSLVRSNGMTCFCIKIP
ncbi:sensor histidine kinase [Archangium violaceum]|uniref:sensor histidine kinase n=1 Tax=Archangium violaceum TaxID=83451 RepID=UPI0036DF4720